jgi:cytoskeletal protein RodZ
MNKKLGYGVIAAAVVIILGLVWALVVVASNNDGEKEASTPEKTSQTTVTRTLTGKELAADRADVYKAATELLESTNAPAKQEEFTALLSELDGAKVSDIPEGFLDKVRFADLLDEEQLKVTTYQALITFASLAKASSEDGKIASLYADGPMSIMVDQETGTAQVPMNIFVSQEGQANTFSMEFVYVDGEWKMAPYSVLDQLRLSLAMQQQAAAPQQ